MEKTVENVANRLKEYGIFTEIEINIAFALCGKTIDTLDNLIIKCTDFDSLDNFMSICDKWDMEDTI